MRGGGGGGREEGGRRRRECERGKAGMQGYTQSTTQPVKVIGIRQPHEIVAPFLSEESPIRRHRRPVGLAAQLHNRNRSDTMTSCNNMPHRHPLDIRDPDPRVVMAAELEQVAALHELLRRSEESFVRGRLRECLQALHHGEAGLEPASAAAR